MNGHGAGTCDPGADSARMGRCLPMYPFGGLGGDDNNRRAASVDEQSQR